MCSTSVLMKLILKYSILSQTWEQLLSSPDLENKKGKLLAKGRYKFQYTHLEACLEAAAAAALSFLGGKRPAAVVQKAKGERKTSWKGGFTDSLRRSRRKTCPLGFFLQRTCQPPRGLQLSQKREEEMNEKKTSASIIGLHKREMDLSVFHRERSIPVVLPAR